MMFGSCFDVVTSLIVEYCFDIMISLVVKLSCLFDVRTLSERTVGTCLEIMIFSTVAFDGGFVATLLFSTPVDSCLYDMMSLSMPVMSCQKVDFSPKTK